VAWCMRGNPLAKARRACAMRAWKEGCLRTGVVVHTRLRHCHLSKHRSQGDRHFMLLYFLSHRSIPCFGVWVAFKSRSSWDTRYSLCTGPAVPASTSRLSPSYSRPSSLPQLLPPSPKSWIGIFRVLRVENAVHSIIWIFKNHGL